MTQEKIIASAAATLSALHGTAGAPESVGYLATGSDAELWNAVRSILTRAGWVKIQNHWMTLTEDGARKADAINALLTK